MIAYVRVALESRFGGIRFGVSDPISELVGSPFYFLKEMFIGVPISVCLVTKSEAVSVACSFQPRSRIDEKHGVVDIVFLGEFREKDRGNTLVPRRKQPDVVRFVRFGIDSTVQSVALIVEMDHGLVECDMIRLGTVCRLYISLLDPIVNSRARPFDTETL